MSEGEKTHEILYRDHRGGLDESLETTRTIKTVEDIKSHLNETLSVFGKQVDSISFKHLGLDTRTGWDTYNVIMKYKGEKGEFVAGMTNGIPESRNLEQKETLKEVSDAMPEITTEKVKSDISKMLTLFGTFGKGSEQDRSAQLILQSIDVLSRRLDDVVILKMLYLDNSEASKLLPETVLQIATDFIEGKINQTEAKKNLEKIKSIYQEAFQEMGINPVNIDMLNVK
ncbi:MAG: hypothetical protein WC875_02150 [Candidatus Absconditabacterales bacterium]